MDKSEIIPFGTKTHRERVIATRKINPRDQAPFDDCIKIAKDGEIIRILGAQIGNHSSEETPWEPMIDKIQHALKIWGRSHPTLKGRKLITQMIIGGFTRFLAKAQGMPKRIEDALTKITCDFIWDNSSHPRIALKTFFHPIEEGGLNLLDISTRNKAIEIMEIKTYLDLLPKRPTWAKLMDIIIDAAAPKHTNPKARINTFLQTWRPSIKGEQVKILNNDIIRMIKVAQKYQLTFVTVRLAPHLKTQLPAWYHPNAVYRPMSNPTMKCLIQDHNVSTIVDMLKMSA